MEGETADPKKAVRIIGQDIESSGESSDEEEKAKPEDSDSGSDKQMFINPLLAAKKGKKAADGEASEEWSDDSDEDVLGGKGKKKVKGVKLGKRGRKSKDQDDVQDFFKNEFIEEVPANDPATREKQGYESMDSDDIAETRILARKMLRKKDRSEIIEASYNRFSSHENPDTLPSWFVEDESKHRFSTFYNPTKEEIAVEKEAIKAYNARPSKKVEQAKARKKKRLAKAMEKIKKKA